MGLSEELPHCFVVAFRLLRTLLFKPNGLLAPGLEGKFGAVFYGKQFFFGDGLGLSRSVRLGGHVGSVG